MFSNITWKAYATAIILILVIYYAVLYRGTLIALLKRKASEDDDSDKQTDQQKYKAPQHKDQQSDDLMEELETTILDIKNNILIRAGIAAGKDALISDLRTRLAGNRLLAQQAFRVAITNYIIQNAKELCGVSFSEDELEAVWRSVPR